MIKSTSKNAYLRVLPLVVMLIFGALPAFGQSDVTTPGDPISPLADTVAGGPNNGPGASPGGELVSNAINDQTQKYLNFGDPNPPAAPGENTGFYVTPSLGSGVGGTIVTGVRLYTANDAEPRDPASYTLEGTLGNPSIDAWTLIASGLLSLPSGRNMGGMTPIDPAIHFNQLVSFSNLAGFTSYRLLFPTLKGPNQNSMQIAEVELLGGAVPEPASLGLLGLVAAGLLARRRRA